MIYHDEYSTPNEPTINRTATQLVLDIIDARSPKELDTLVDAMLCDAAASVVFDTLPVPSMPVMLFDDLDEYGHVPIRNSFDLAMERLAKRDAMPESYLIVASDEDDILKNVMSDEQPRKKQKTYGPKAHRKFPVPR